MKKTRKSMMHRVKKRIKIRSEPPTELYRIVTMKILYGSGITDKNGREIFEGDKVRVQYQSGYRYTRTGIVKFERGEFKVGDLNLADSLSTELEVIR